MKEIIFGIISGIVTSLGMGGGAILVLLLGLFTNMEQQLIQGTNLIFFIPTSVTAILINSKNKNINFKQALIIIVAGSVGAFIGSFLSFKIRSDELKKYFGIFLVFIAIFEIFTFIRQYIINKNEK